MRYVARTLRARLSLRISKKKNSRSMHEANHAAARREGILQEHHFVGCMLRTAWGEDYFLGGNRGACASAEAEDEDNGKERDG